MVYINNVLVGNTFKPVTEKEFTALTQAQRDVGTLFFLKESGRRLWKKLKKTADLAGYAGFIKDITTGGTLIDAIALLSSRMGGMTFTVNNDRSVSVSYDSTVTPATPNPKPSGLSPEQENTYWKGILGNESTISSLGFKSMAEAIQDLFTRLHQFGFSYNSTLGTLTITDYSEPSA